MDIQRKRIAWLGLQLTTDVLNQNVFHAVVVEGAFDFHAITIFIYEL